MVGAQPYTNQTHHTPNKQCRTQKLKCRPQYSEKSAAKLNDIQPKMDWQTTSMSEKSSETDVKESKIRVKTPRKVYGCVWLVYG